MSAIGNASGSRGTLLLVRHAHTEMAGRFCGLSDPPLSRQGLAQLAGLNQRLKAYPITHIFSSDLRRARQTAESIARRCKLHVEYLKVFHELAFGSWEGLEWDEVTVRDPAYAQHWLDNYPSVPAPGGEYFEDFFQRVQYAMAAVAGQAPGGCAVVVTHAGVIRTFLGSLGRVQGTAWDVTNCGYASCREVWHEAGQWHLPAASVAGDAGSSSLQLPVEHRRGFR